MDEDELETFKQMLDEKFDELMNRGEDLTSFLYFPHNFLSEKIKNYLDEMLIIKAYEQIEVGSLTADNFVVYDDEYMTIKLDKKEQQLELLDKLLNYFLEREEYEKCARINTMKIVV